MNCEDKFLCAKSGLTAQFKVRNKKEVTRFPMLWNQRASIDGDFEKGGMLENIIQDIGIASTIDNQK